MSYNYSAGPPQPAGQPAGQSAGPAFSQAGLQDVVNSWITSVTKPNVQTYAAEVPRADQNRLLMSVGLATVISAVLGLIGGIFSHNMVGSFLTALIGTPLGFFIGQGIIYLLARAMGGTGSFMTQSYVMSTFWAPLLVLRSIPIVGGFIGIIAGLYSLYLTYLALQPTQRLDSTKSMMVVGILLAIGVVLAICAFAIGAAALLGLAAASGGAQ
jgi:hypothetical protein